jgi:glycosyltransferase involved in cell wall biosynthesis
MKISVITIAYNSGATIESTIRSVISQRHSPVEYLIVDGGSSDQTLAVVQRYTPHITRWVSEPDRGIYDAMNKGIAMSTGEIIGILNSDDYYADDRVLTDVAAMFASTGCEALYADLVYVDRRDTSRILRTWRAGAYRHGRFRSGWMPPHPTFFVKKSCYDRLGLYNLSLRSAADYELMLRFIHRHGIAVSYLPRIITHMRAGGQSNLSLGNRIRANLEDRMAWRMNGLRPGLFTLTWKPLSKVFQFVKR